jgi:GDPmannose 4,6-dehydratase
VNQLVGKAEKARKKLNWSPRTKFADLVRLMVDADIELLKRQSVDSGQKNA